MPKSKSYLDHKLSFDSNGNIFDEEGRGVMMGWEAPMMETSARLICSQGGDILNIGYGMGLIDNYIENYKINSHWIIEAHPDIQLKMLQKKWLFKPHVKLLFGKWQTICPYLPKFDGIYIDTFEESLIPFFKNVHKLLKPKGVLSFFYNDSDINKLEYNKHRFNILKKYFDIELKKHTLPQIDQNQHLNNNQGFYWDPTKNNYYIPKCILKNKT